MQTSTSLYHWTYVAQENLSDLSYIHIIYWNDGMNLIGYDQNNNLVQVQHYEWQKNTTTEQLEELLLDDPLLGGAELVKKIWILSKENMIVPKQLFDPEATVNWFKKLHFVDNNHHIEISHLSQPAGYSLDLINKTHLETIFNNSNEAPLVGLYSCLLANFNHHQNNIVITCLGNQAVIYFYDNEKLQMIQLTHLDEANLIHLIHEIGNNMSLEQKDIKIQLQGYSEKIEEIEQFLQQYFAVNTAFTNAAFFNQLAICE